MVGLEHTFYRGASRCMHTENSNTDIIEKIYNANSIEHDAIASSHDQNVPYYNYAPARARYLNFLINELKSLKLEHPKILEIGCGTADYSNDLCSIGSYTGIDLSKQMIKVAKTKCKAGNFLVAPIENLNDEQGYDFIFSTSFLHHLPSLPQFKNQLIRLLRTSNSVYVGLHEPIIPKKQTLLSKLDTALAIIAGHHLGEFGAIKRLLFTLAGYYRFDPAGEANPFFTIQDMIKIKNKINPFCKTTDSQMPPEAEANYDESLVDYQLLSDFTSEMRKEFDVENYTYSCYEFAQTQGSNYMRTVMTKDQLRAYQTAPV